MRFVSIGYFLLVMSCVGCVVDLLVKEWKADRLEKGVIRLGVGIGVFPLIGVFLNVFHVPLDWRIFLGIGAACLAGALLKRGVRKGAGGRRVPVPKRRRIATALLIILFAVTAHMYIHGSFTYTWFEDGDPWGYAVSSKYIAEEKTYTAPFRFNHYAAPYTQGFSIVMGVLHQTNASIYWTLKFFNALIISFGVVFFYFFAKRFAPDEDLAMTATFFLFAVPAWLSHFVFPLNFNMVLFVVTLYVVAMMNSPEGRLERGWRVAGALLIGSLWVTHFYTAVIGSFLIALLCLNKVLVEKETDGGILLSLLVGFVLSMLFYVPAYAPYWTSVTNLRDLGGVEGLLPLLPRLATPQGVLAGLAAAFFFAALFLFRRRLLALLGKAFPTPFVLAIGYLCLFAVMMALLLIPEEIFKVEGTGTREYTFSDFFVAGSQNIINNPRGIGMVVMAFFCLGAAYCVAGSRTLFSGANLWLSTTLIWSAVSILVILGSYFSISIAPFRMWTFFAPFACMMAAYGVWRTVRKIPGRRFRIAFSVTVAAAVIPTSFIPKYTFNTGIWPDHMVRIEESQALYAKMREGAVPKDSKALRLCGDSMFLVGYDMNLVPVLDRETGGYHTRALRDTAGQNWEFLKRKGISFVTLGLSCAAETRLSGPALEDYARKLERKKIELERHPGFAKVLETRTEALYRVR